MSDEKLLHELEELKREVAKLKTNRSMMNFLRKTFSKTSVLIGIALTFVVSSIIVYSATITKPYTFTDGTVISAAEVNSNFDILYSESNSQHTRIATLESNYHAPLNIRYIISIAGIYPTRDWYNGSLEDQFVGEIRMFAGNYEPSGWMFCDGRLLQITDYSALYSIIGNQYGGNGTSTFALPDLRGKVAMHPN